MWEAIARNFAAISTAVTMVAIAAALAFVQAYLASFDWTLIWYLEYPDVIKFVLVAIAMASAIYAIILTLVENVLGFARSPSGSEKWVPIIGTAALFLFAGASLFWTYSSGGAILYPISLLSAGILLVGLVWTIVRDVRAFPAISAAGYINSLWIALAFFVTAGAALGYYVQYASKLRHDVVLKGPNGGLIFVRDLKTIMILSHHSLFWTGDHALVVPTADVLKLEGKSPDAPQPTAVMP